MRSTCAAIAPSPHVPELVTQADFGNRPWPGADASVRRTER